MPHPRHIGKEAEDRAAKMLLEKGYLLITRRYKSLHGEIDIVALDQSGETESIVFVEVKFRAEDNPESAVGWTKRRHFDQAVQEYYARMGQPPLPARYDIISVSNEGLRHIEDAFRSDQ